MAFTTTSAKKPQPDNFDGLKAGKLAKVSDPVGLTVEGLQEWHDEACLAVLNNKFGDGIAWHDVSCHFRWEYQDKSNNYYLIILR